MSGSNPISIETLFSAPNFSRAQISPDGSRIAYLSIWSDRLNIFIRNIGGSDAKSYRLTSDAHRNIEAFCWTPGSTAIVYLQDTSGDENWHLHRVAVADDKPQSTNLTPFPGVGVMEFAFSPADPKTIILQMNARNPAFIDLHRLNTETGEIETLAENTGRFVRWLAIPGGLPHAIIINSENDYELSRYENGTSFRSPPSTEMTILSVPCRVCRHLTEKACGLVRTAERIVHGLPGSISRSCGARDRFSSERQTPERCRRAAQAKLTGSLERRW